MLKFLQQVWSLGRAYRTRLMLGILTGMLGGLIEPLMIATIAFVYALVFPSANSPDIADKMPWAPEAIRHWASSAQKGLSSGVRAHPWSVIAVMAIIPAVVVLRGIVTYLNTYFLQWASIRIVSDLRIRLFEHLMSLSAGFFSRARTGELISRVLSDTGQFQDILASASVVIFKDPFTLVFMTALLVLRQPKLTLLSLVVMPLCMIPVVVYGRKARRSGRELQTLTAELSSIMMESFSGSRIIKAYNLEKPVVAQFRQGVGRYVAHFMRIVRSAELPGPLLEAVGALGVSIVLIYLCVQPGTRPDSTDFVTFVLAIFAMYRPLKNLTRLNNNLVRARAATERVFELLETPNSIAEPANPLPLRAAGSPIRFEHVNFSYDEKPVLQDFTLEIPAGHFVALVGASGSGKTTVTSLLLRFYDPAQGVIRIGNTDLRAVASRDLRNQIAVVTQETVLFNQTIRYNISLGRPDADEKEIIEAAKHAHANDFILEKSDGFETVIGEKGIALSGGQRQRIAIARALVKNAPILILDEATSALDTEAERAVQAALDELMQGRTTLCIAHRLSTVQKADMIVVMDQGRIVETGTHAELMERRGTYYKLYQLQFNDPAA